MKRRLPAYLAIVAVALQALWPLLAQAKPASVVLVPVCTVQGVTHYLELPKGEAPVERKAASQHDHCSFCSFGGERAIAGDTVAHVVPSDRAFAVPDSHHVSVVESEAFRFGRPRAPPLLPCVDSNSHHSGRTDEEAVVVQHRGARAGDAHAGRRVVRLGVLHA